MEVDGRRHAISCSWQTYMNIWYYCILVNEGFDQPVHMRRLGGAFPHRAPVCISTNTNICITHLAPSRFHMVKHAHYVAF